MLCYLERNNEKKCSYSYQFLENVKHLLISNFQVDNTLIVDSTSKLECHC